MDFTVKDDLLYIHMMRCTRETDQIQIEPNLLVARP